MFMIFWLAASFASASPTTVHRMTSCRMMLTVSPSSAWKASSRNCSTIAGDEAVFRITGTHDR